MTNNADLEMILADLGSEFIEDCSGKLDLIDNLIDQISDRVGHHDHHVMDIERIVHAMGAHAKGFGFSALVNVAHAFKDFISLADTQSRINVADCRAFADALRFVVIKRGRLGSGPINFLVL